MAPHYLTSLTPIPITLLPVDFTSPVLPSMFPTATLAPTETKDRPLNPFLEWKSYLLPPPEVAYSTSTLITVTPSTPTSINPHTLPTVYPPLSAHNLDDNIFLSLSSLIPLTPPLLSRNRETSADRSERLQEALFLPSLESAIRSLISTSDLDCISNKTLVGCDIYGGGLFCGWTWIERPDPEQEERRKKGGKTGGVDPGEWTHGHEQESGCGECGD